jgi:hypothetical protein
MSKETSPYIEFVGQCLKSGVVPKLHLVFLHQLQYFHLQVPCQLYHWPCPSSMPCSLEWEVNPLLRQRHCQRNGNSRKGESWNRQGPHQESVPGYCLFGIQFGVTNGLTLHNSSDESMLKPSPVLHHLQIAIPSNAEMSSLLCQSSWNAPLLLGLSLDSSSG